MDRVVSDACAGNPPAASSSAWTDLLPCPFVAGPMITDPRLFVGRKEEIRMILSRMEGAQPISINIVGERRIGKSSLMYHIFQTYDQRVSRPAQYVVAYLSLQSLSPQTAAEFYRAVARAFLERPAVRQDPELAEALSRDPMTPDAFREALRRFQEKGLRPVLCLDEFEEFLKYPEEFSDGFYDNLRALTNESALMLIIASQRPIADYRKEQRLTSRFFNDAHTERLGEFAEEEARALVRLPASTVPGAPEALSLEEQHLALQLGGRHPCRLQLAAWALCQARLHGKDVAWAREEFERQVKNQFAISEEPRLLFRLVRELRRPLWDLPRHLGYLARGTRKAATDLRDWLLGVLIIAIVILVLLRVLTGEQLLDLARRLLGLSGG